MILWIKLRKIRDKQDAERRIPHPHSASFFFSVRCNAPFGLPVHHGVRRSTASSSRQRLFRAAPAYRPFTAATAAA